MKRAGRFQRAWTDETDVQVDGPVYYYHDGMHYTLPITMLWRRLFDSSGTRPPNLLWKNYNLEGNRIYGGPFRSWDC
jgi:hypothetical protein